MILGNSLFLLFVNSTMGLYQTTLIRVCRGLEQYLFSGLKVLLIKFAPLHKGVFFMLSDRYCNFLSFKASPWLNATIISRLA